MNESSNIRSSLKPRTLLLRYLTVMYLVLGAWYLQWRLFHLLDGSVVWLSLLVAVAEIYSYFWWAMFFLGLWRSIVREVVPISEMNPPFPINELPVVDVAIVCEDLPREIVEKTVKASLAIDYPREKLCVYLIDRTNSVQLRQAIEVLALEDVTNFQTTTNKNLTEANKLGKLQVNSTQSNLELVLSWFETLRQPSISDRVWYESKLALAESFDNVIDHAHKQLPSDTPIEIEVIIARDFLTIKIWDCGPGFNFDLFLQQRTDRVNDSAERGRGLQILKQIADRLDYTVTKDKGNCLLIVKYYDCSLLNRLSRCRYLTVENKDKFSNIDSHLNYAIVSAETRGDFLLTLDADLIPKPEILQRLLPYFYQYNLDTDCYEANQIAFVQTPQVFSNIQTNDFWIANYYLFDKLIQQGKDGINAVLYRGTNALLRKKALLSLLKPPFSANENNSLVNLKIDILLHTAGWQGVFESEELVESCALNDSRFRLSQKLRSVLVNLQVLLKENPWKNSALTFWQKQQYFSEFYRYFAFYWVLIFTFCPIVYFYTGLVPIRYDNISFAIHFIPAFVVNFLTFVVASWGISLKEIWHLQQQNAILLPILTQIAGSIFCVKSARFLVITRKTNSIAYLQTIWLNCLILLLTILGLIWSCVKFSSIGNLEQPKLFVIHVIWSIYNIFLLFPIVRLAIFPSKSSQINKCWRNL